MAKRQTSDPFIAEHYWYEVFTFDGMLGSGPACGLLFCFLLYFSFLVAHRPLSYCLGKCCKWAMIEDIEIDEDIDAYPNCLDDDDKEWTVQEEMNMRNCYTLKCISDETIQEIYAGHLKKPDMHLQGVHTYDLLRNPIYIKEFQYFAASDADRESVIADDDRTEDNDASQSDLVRICLNLGYLDK